MSNYNSLLKEISELSSQSSQLGDCIRRLKSQQLECEAEEFSFSRKSKEVQFEEVAQRSPSFLTIGKVVQKQYCLV